MIYLDNAATTAVASEVLDAMLPYLRDSYGNAGSLHTLGRQAAKAIEKAREQVAEFMNAKPDQIIFTSGGTESNNLAILGSKDYMERVGKRHIITSPTEHESVLTAINSLCESSKQNIKSEFYSSFLPVDKFGQVSVETLQKELNTNNDIGFVSVMYANNEIGTRNDIEQIGQLCRKKHILFHTDCVQAAGSFELNANLCDLMSVSSHKIHGAKGVGALYVKDKQKLQAIIHGGTEQEFGYRGGTENVAGIVGFGAACEISAKQIEENLKKIVFLKNLFYETLIAKLKEDELDDCVKINGLLPCFKGKTLSLTFRGVDAQTLVLMMDANGVFVSAGSACCSHDLKPSHVLTAIGLSDEDARSTIRVSFSAYNTQSEIEQTAVLLAKCVKRLRIINV